MQNVKQAVLKIGDVARLVGISPSAIRGWENLGLVHPQRTESKYRLYTNEDVRLLKKAHYLRKVRGFNPPAIVPILKREGLIRFPPQCLPMDPWGHSCANCAPNVKSVSRKSPLQWEFLSVF